ncbi:head GIN domain-containing protein [Myxococcus dinghuensis]|uniref:head GIN domain-containing protein n=1 Tax=Myxococcus dinghuensis TaxID=2906761 RepID=UPI00389911F1
MKTARMSLLVPFLLLTGAAHAEDAANDDASRKAEVREVSDFDGVSFGHGIHAKVKVGPKSVRVEGPQELVSRLRFVVEDGKLQTEVDRKGGFFGSNFNGGKVRVYVSNPRIEEVDASGGSHVEADVTSEDDFTAHASGGATLSVRGVDARKVEVEASGGGTVTLEGRAKALEVEASGGAVVKAKNLKGLKDLEVEASGGARVEANPSNSVSVEGSGGATVQCGARPPKTNVRASGGTQVLYDSDA